MSNQRPRVGIVGTGFVAKLRAELFTADSRSVVVAIAGNPERAKTIIDNLQIEARIYVDPAELIARADLDLVVVANINRDHGSVTDLVLRSGKAAIVEYPLALDFGQAKALVEYAASQNLLLHIEHIELLSGVHLAAQAHLSQIGTPLRARYSTQSPQRPCPDKWTYMPELFGFPLVASVSRIHRLTHLFGKVKSISCQLSYSGESLPEKFSNCICAAQLQFANGIHAEVGYAKGEYIWQQERSLEIEGTEGGIFFKGEQGKLITSKGESEIIANAPKGLFKQDTEAVLDFLETAKPIYTHSNHALYALSIANAAAESVATNQTIIINETE
jgi:biliverdin reductase